VKSLYLNFFHKQFNIERDEQDTKKFEIGHDVGKYAQQLFPSGVDCGYVLTNDRNKSIELTRQYINEGKTIIYEAAFEYDGLLCFSDILVKDGNEWIIYEVKSSAYAKNYYTDDVSFQYYVISKNIPVKDAFVVYLNSQYVRHGDIDIKQLFAMESVFEKAINLQDNIKLNTDEYKKITELKTIPEIRISEHCKEPFTCDFKGFCWKDIPEYSVFDIQNMRGKQYDLYNMGVVNIEDIPPDFSLNDKQRLEINSYLNNTDYVDKAAIKEFLNKVSYPLYFLDFETYMSAIPEFDNSRPYQPIPFQFSLYYKESKESEAIPYSFLADTTDDPRKAFIENLIAKIEKLCIVIVYFAGFEKSRINDLARDFPEYKEQLDNINSRIVDLMEPFRQKAYYKPSMKHSYSLKAVLPAIDPKYSYDNLNIQEGSEASNEFVRLRTVSDNTEIENIRKNLIDYCNRDTYGMVVILEELERIIL
jgi:predicted RecB family nuclease